MVFYFGRTALKTYGILCIALVSIRLSNSEIMQRIRFQSRAAKNKK